MNAAGILVDESLIAGTSYQENKTPQTMALLLNRPDPPTAIFAANDYLAACAWQAAREHGLHIPQNLALVGCGDVEMARFLGFTTIQQHPQQIGLIAAERLLTRLKQPELRPQALIQPTNLIQWLSSGA